MRNSIILLALLFVSCTSGGLKRYEITGFAQGTTYKIVYYDNRESVKKAEIDGLLSAFDKSCSLYDSTSLISRINRNETDTVDTYISDCEKVARHIYKISNGAYDITSEPLSEAYGFLRKNAIDSVNVDSILQFVGHDKIRIENGKIIKADSRMAINLNSIAQGYSVDLVAKYIADKGLTNYLVEIGGEVYCKGVKDDQSLWKVGIDKPMDGNMEAGKDLQLIVELTNKGLNTSGNYRKFYKKESGERVNHILDPRTGLSTNNDMLSATIIADNTTIADGYATMLIVIGSEKSIEFLNNNSDIEGYIIYHENDSIKTYSTIKEKNR